MHRRLLYGGVLATLVVASAAMSAACGGDNGPAVAGATLLKSEAPRSAADPAAGAGAAGSLVGFSGDLYAIFARQEGNIVFSPYSAMVALAMARAGASGETLDQMSAVLHAAAAGDLDAGLNAIDQALAKRPGEYQWADKRVRLELSTANQLFGQRDFPFHDAFLDALAAQYGAGIRLVDYQQATEAARRAINDWVAEQTRGRIPELIAEGVLDDATRLVLTNAIYLNAPWMHRFDRERTADGDFTRLDGSTVRAAMMRLSEQLRYAAGAGYQAVELPYVDGSLRMLVVVPDAGRFAEIEGRVGEALLAEATNSLEVARVNLSFPRFEFRTQAGLKEALTELGMPVAFDEVKADFSGMSPLGGDMFIQDVVHEAFIAVDEDGTEAAAATAVIAGVTSAPQLLVDLDVDRPFLFAIQDRETGAILFLGRVVDPTAG